MACFQVLALASLTALCFALGNQHNSRYAGHKLLRVYPESPQDISRLHHLAQDPNNQISYLDGPPEDHLALSPVDLLLSSPSALSRLHGALRHSHVAYDVMTDDLQRELDILASENARGRAMLKYFNSYHPLSEIHAFMESLVKRCDGRCSLIDIGTSYEGRPLKLIKISGSGQAEGDRRRIWIDAGIHAREWISHATAQFLMERLVEDYVTDPDTQTILDTYDWYILPCVNPDGYNYTWETDRLWRKTRRPNEGTACVGTDANRNFNFHWGAIGTSSDACANNYQGPQPYSEPEALAIAEYIQQQAGTWDMFISLHSKGQLVMAPWGYKYELPADYDDLEAVGLSMVDAIHSTHGENYTFGAASSVLYRSSGTSRDWARGVADIKYVYTIELRDKGRYGWILPPHQIIPTGQEIWAAMKAAAKTMIMASTDDV